MGSYSAVVSLQQTIERILESSRLSLDSSSREVLRVIYIWKLRPLQKILERFDRTSKSKSRKKLNDLDTQIKEAVWRFEDLLESHLCDQILSQYSERDAFLISIDLEEDKYLQRKLDYFIQTTLNELEEEYIFELENMPETVEEDELGGMKKANMVGFSYLFQEVKHYLTIDEKYGNINFSLVGMSGTGKTTLAINFFEDPDVSGRFQHRAWVTIGRSYDFNEIAHSILAQLNLDDHINEEKLVCKKCLIVLDDVWDEKVLHFLKSYLLDKDNTLMVRILVTTCYESKIEDED